MTVWFTSDPHFGHNYVAKLRGFSSTQEHDEALIENYSRIIRKNDATWWLGDLSVSNPRPALDIIKHLPGVHHLVYGNHDTAHPMHRNSARQEHLYRDAFVSAQVYARRRIKGMEVLLCHMPYTADHTDTPRYLQYRLPDLGRTLLHGHTHSTEQASQTIHGTQQVHVGVDAWDMKPVSLSTIEEML